MVYTTIPEVFLEIAANSLKKTALLHKKEGVYFPVSYKELLSKVKIFGAALQKFGIKKGDKVAILSENRPEWVVSDLAVMLIGGVSVPLHSTFNANAICQILNHSEAKILIVSNSILLNKVLLFQRDFLYLEKIIFLDKLTEAEKQNSTIKIFSFRALLEHSKDDLHDDVLLEADDSCTIIYTSGTTGHPKGVVLSHRNILSNVEAIIQLIPLKKGDTFLSFLPLSHVLERTVGYYVPILHGATIAYAENVKRLSHNLKEIMPTVLISVPRVFEKMHDSIWDKINAGHPLKKKLFQWALRQKRGTVRYFLADLLVFRQIRGRLGGRLRLTVSGGASLSRHLGQFFYNIGMVIIEGYGLTETSPIISTNRPKEVKFGSVGKVIPGVKLKINDKKGILVKGPNVFLGYFKDEVATRAMFDAEGWFMTGDLGFMDKQGYVSIIGREKEMFVLSGGKNVWPEPIESMLNEDKFILQSIVVGNKQKFVSALIVPDWQEIEIYLKKQNMPLVSRDKLLKNPAILEIFTRRIEEKINPILSDIEQVKKFKLLASQFSQENEELTPTLKLRRHIIERHYEKEIEDLYHE